MDGGAELPRDTGCSGGPGRGSWDTSWNGGKKLRQEPCSAWMRAAKEEGLAELPGKTREETE